MLRPVYKVKNLDTLNDIYHSYYRKIETGIKFFLFKKGPLTVGASYLCGFIKSDNHLETPNLQFHVSPASTDFLGKTTLHNFPAFTPTIVNLRPTSRGSIEIKSPDTRIAPRIQMNYLSTDEDKEMAGKSIKITIRFLSNEVRADGLKVIVHKKKCNTKQKCTVKKISSALEYELQVAILKKAAIFEKEYRRKTKSDCA